MERVNPMYGQMPVVLADVIRPYIPSINSALQEIHETKLWLRNYSRNKWVQKIKLNARRNKRKRQRCKRKWE